MTVDKDRRTADNEDEVPARVAAAEERARFRELLRRSSLGDADVKDAHAQMRRYLSALPDRWVPVTELQRLLGLYRERRETWADTHAVADGKRAR